MAKSCIVVFLLTHLVVLAAASARVGAAPLKIPEAVQSAYPEAPKEELVIAWVGLEMILNREFESALKLIADFQTTNPTSILPSLGKMFLYHVRMLENFDFRYGAEFEAALAENDRLMPQLKDKGATRWDFLLRGASLGMKGLWNARYQNWLKAASYGWKGLEFLEKAKKDHPVYPPIYDVYYGFGLYHYWVATLTGKNSVLSLFPARRGQGLQELSLCAEKALLTATLAKFALAYFTGLEGQTKKALEYGLGLKEQHPKNILLRTLIGRLYLADGKVDLGIAELQDVLHEEPRLTYVGFHLARGLHLHKRDAERARLHLEAFVNDQNVKRPPALMAEAWLFLSEIYLARNDRSSAQDYFKLVKSRKLPAFDEWRYKKLKRALEGKRMSAG